MATAWAVDVFASTRLSISILPRMYTVLMARCRNQRKNRGLVYCAKRTSNDYGVQKRNYGCLIQQNIMDNCSQRNTQVSWPICVVTARAAVIHTIYVYIHLIFWVKIGPQSNLYGALTIKTSFLLFL